MTTKLDSIIHKMKKQHDLLGTEVRKKLVIERAVNMYFFYYVIKDG